MRYEVLEALRGRGYLVKQSDLVAPGKIVVDRERKVVVARNIEHLSWQVQMAYLDLTTRLRVGAILADFARRNGVEPAVAQQSKTE